MADSIKGTGGAQGYGNSSGDTDPPVSGMVRDEADDASTDRPPTGGGSQNGSNPSSTDTSAQTAKPEART
jgi:hypothetical protein